MTLRAHRLGMGFFGTYFLQGDTWTEAPATPPTADAVPWLFVDIHDSDFTVLRYAPPGPGTGTAYLGFTPRSYFEDEAASRPTDAAVEAAGLAAWLALRAQPGAVNTAIIEAFLARDEDPNEPSADPDGFDEDDFADDEDELLDEGDIFVEIKTARFLHQVGLPLPEELAPFNR